MAARKKQDGGLDQSIESFRASLERSITVSRDKLQEVLDDAVDRGRMTRRDAETVVGELIDRGRRQRDNLLDELERLGKQLGKHSEKVARQAREVTEKPLVRAEQKLRKGRTKPATKPAITKTTKATPKPANNAAFPIADYDNLTANEIRKSLNGLTPAQLKAVRERETAGAARKTVLGAIEKKLEKAG